MCAFTAILTVSTHLCDAPQSLLQIGELCDPKANRLKTHTVMQ